ncbi:fibrillarin-like rRNA/tRNA 2'-O-methyltransferase, partial [Candidatus Micrarchaeota archaeon]|nr:fibrillarin-like rRNA/tRNA 2'-O-methyltransferase [Candidatus Micrarchaeota archaeon]
EKLETIDGTEYRQWNPYKSKLAAAIQKGLKESPFQSGTNVLYLGSAEGTTVSHLSDIVGEKGSIIGIDLSARVMPKFLKLCEYRSNIVPILADANKPEFYSNDLKAISFQVLYQDVSQPNQAEIFLKNSRFLEANGKGLLVIKAASIDSSAPASRIVNRQTKELKPSFNIIQTVSLEPFEKGHAIIYCQKKD